MAPAWQILLHLILTGFLHYHEEVERSGRDVLLIVRQLEIVDGLDPAVVPDPASGLSVEDSLVRVAALGGAPDHRLAIDVHFTPLLLELGATTPVRGLFILESDVDGFDTRAQEWARQHRSVVFSARYSS